MTSKLLLKRVTRIFVLMFIFVAIIPSAVFASDITKIMCSYLKNIGGYEIKETKTYTVDYGESMVNGKESQIDDTYISFWDTADAHATINRVTGEYITKSEKTGRIVSVGNCVAAKAKF